MSDIEQFFYDKNLVIAYLSQPEKIEGPRNTKFRLVTDEFPPSVREEIWVKDTKGFSYQGCVARPVDPRLASELIRSGILVSDGEKHFKIPYDRRTKPN